MAMFVYIALPASKTPLVKLKLAEAQAMMSMSLSEAQIEHHTEYDYRVWIHIEIMRVHTAHRERLMGLGNQH